MVDLADFTASLHALGPFEPSPKVALAVSGGRDSLCLLHLLKRWADQNAADLIAFTVDHGLRPNSAQEAASVADICSTWDVPHETLRWLGPKPTSKVQEAARQARYDLLTAACHRLGVLHLCLGHTSTDQIETIHMRQKRSTDQALGLTGMTSCAHVGGVRVLRPLLATTRADVTAYCNAYNITWIDDPSNKNIAFERAALRANYLAVADDPSAQKHNDQVVAQRQKLEQEATQILVQQATVDPRGYLIFDFDGFGRTIEAHTLALQWAVRWVRGAGGYLPSAQKVKPVLYRHGGRKTVGGVQGRWQDRMLKLYREARNIESLDMIEGQSVRWDGRFQVISRLAGSLKPLGLPPKSSIVALQGGQDLITWPTEVRQTWPSVWRGEHLIAIGSLDPENPLFVWFDPQLPLVPRHFG